MPTRYNVAVMGLACFDVGSPNCEVRGTTASPTFTDVTSHPSARPSTQLSESLWTPTRPYHRAVLKPLIRRERAAADGRCHGSMAAAPHVPLKFVSGGQVGADSIAFHVHDATGIAICGSFPKGCKRDDGRGAEFVSKYKMSVSTGGFSTRDKENAQISDAVVGFLCTKENTGKGTMQTVNIFVNGAYEFVVLTKPEGKNYAVLRGGQKPVIVFWDVDPTTVDEMSTALAGFFNEFRPASVMISGSTEGVWPGTEEFGTKVFLEALSKNGVPVREDAAASPDPVPMSV
eukprot:m.39617 g.39617  ORF g.39617 m.39617 type:complete len:288 (-) comp7986_c0_seq1:432-1295(-)